MGRLRGLRRGAGRVIRGVRAALPERLIDGIPASVLRARRASLAGRRRFGVADLTAFAALLAGASVVVPVGDLDEPGAGGWGASRTGLIALRHDMDNDVENAVRFARWEAERGIRSTYYVLHTDWYFRASGSREPSRLVLRALETIAGLGHEIGVHNDAITAALLTGGDPVEILGADLAALRRWGFEVTGTVAHGHRLCHELGYVNDEIFTECARPHLGAPDRTISHAPPGGDRTTSVALRPVPMASLGLRYEANLAVRGMDYLSDAGGAWNEPFAVAESRFRETRRPLGILVHPCWWALSGEDVTPSRPA